MTKCAVCGEYELETGRDYEFCPVCRWSNDLHQARHPDETGDNDISLNEAKKRWTMKRSLNNWPMELREIVK